MPQCCAVPMCSKKKGGHKFPKDQERLKQWLVAIRRDFTPTKNSIICKAHFAKDDFELPKDSVLDNPRPMLKKTAVPSIFPWDEEHYDLFVHKRKVRQLRHLDRQIKKKENTKKNNLTISSNASDPLALDCSEVGAVSQSNHSSKITNNIRVQRFTVEPENSETTVQSSVPKMEVTVKIEMEMDSTEDTNTDDNVPFPQTSEEKGRVPKTEPADEHVWEVPVMMITPVVNIKCERESDPEPDDEVEQPTPVKTEPVGQDIEEDGAAEKPEPKKRTQAAETASVQQTQQIRKDATTAPLDTRKRYECTVCGKCFSGSQALKAHSRRHTGEKPYGCHECERRFTDRSSLRRHLKTHTGEKPFECNVCQHRFSEKSQLQTHVRTHTGEKPFECSVCQHRFTDKSTLQRHVRTHTGEKPFECDICQRRFNQTSSLRTHFLTHTREKPHICNICHMQFANKQYLEIHSRMHIRAATLGAVPT